MRVECARVALDGAAKMAFGLDPISLVGVVGPVDQVGESCPRGLFKELLRLLSGGLAIGLAAREEQIGIVGKLRAGSSQLEQCHIHLPSIPKRRSEPALR